MKLSWQYIFSRKVAALFTDTRFYIDLVGVFACSILSFVVLHSIVAEQFTFNPSWPACILFTAIAMTCLAAGKVYQTVWAYSSLEDFLLSVRSLFVAFAFQIAFSYGLKVKIPVGYFVLLGFFSGFYLLGLRTFFRLRNDSRTRKHSNTQDFRYRRTIIYGANKIGVDLVKRMRADGANSVVPIGFIDDDLKKSGKRIGGIPVLGTMADLDSVFSAYRPHEFIVAQSDLPGDSLRGILQTLHKYRVRPRLLDSINENEGAFRVNETRNFELEDLLRRPRAKVDLSSVQTLMEGKTVLITGAGGSIGSELARQVAHHQPVKLILLDHGEFNLYQIDHELKGWNLGGVEIVSLLIDIKDKRSLRHAFETHQPHIVLHAAAYKHVHLVQSNPLSAIKNNIGGMINILDCCQIKSVEVLALISSDKAVNPVGVMGATKLACELLLASRAKTSGKRYCAVRFGNVLGSSGSLIPLLKKQIRNLSPITITSAEMTRYFMLIPEAVELVLKAASISRPGDINILRMGEPLRIVEVARSLITLLGKTEEQIPIIFTGPRPGEKMHEELYLVGDEVSTEHPDILVLPEQRRLENSKDWTSVEKAIGEILTLAEAENPEAVIRLMSLVKRFAQVKAADDSGQGVAA